MSNNLGNHTPFSKLMGVPVTEASSDKIVAETTPIHIGRRTSVWQTRINRADDKAVAIVTQTQMVL